MVGLNDNIKDMARTLAAQGYVVYAMDLYDGEVATESARAGELAGAVRSDPETAIAKMRSAVAYLNKMDNVDKIGSLGWCFGGQQSLQLSLNEDIDATVIYYGSLVDDPDQLRNLNGPVLGIFGSEDSSIPVSSVESFETALDSVGVENDINIYNGVGHAFANPSGSNYAPDETKDAWDKTLKFLDENLKDGMMDDSLSQTRVFRLEGENFRFLMDGVEAPELRVKQGDRVRIEFTSVSGFHDWVVDEFNAATEKVNEGGSTFVEFTADKKGTFEYYCSVGRHRENGMFGSLIVE